MHSLIRFSGVAALVGSLVFVTACEDSTVGSPVEDPRFSGDVDGDSGVSTPIESGDHECSLLVADSCGDSRACVRAADGIRICVESQGLAVGEACSTHRFDECAGGSLCTVTDLGARCLALCVDSPSSCPSGASCSFVLLSEGERVGVCVESLEDR